MLGIKLNKMVETSKNNETAQLDIGAVIRRRHKWKRVGHLYDHTWECQRCGCIKDAVRMFSTEYRLNGETFEKAPNCPAAFL